MYARLARDFFVIGLILGSTTAQGILKNPFAEKYTPSPDRYNYFDAELLDVYSRENTGNVIVSPLSLKLALAMLMEGAVGKSADEIRTALRIPVDGDEIQTGLEHKLNSLVRQTGSSEVIKIASRIFVSDQYDINETYRSSLKRKYGTEITKVRFHQPHKLAYYANTWVTNATSGMITKLVDESFVNTNAKAMLANAMYFRGKWQDKFLKDDTTTKCFHTSTGECLKVPMMKQSGSFEYAYIAKLDAYALNLPFEGNRTSMLIVLPKKKNGCAQLSRDMIHVTLEEILHQLKRQEIHVEIPRFTLDSNYDFVPILEKLQILQVFSPGADLSGVTANKHDNLLVSNMFHSAKIIVDEEGTEASAAVGSFFIPLMGGTPTSFIADHPFLFFLRDNVTGLVLFSGKIERPVEETKGEKASPGVLSQSSDPLGKHNTQPLPGRALQHEILETRGDFERTGRIFPQLFGNIPLQSNEMPSQQAGNRIPPLFIYDSVPNERYSRRHFNTKQLKIPRRTYDDSFISFYNNLRSYGHRK